MSEDFARWFNLNVNNLALFVNQIGWRGVLLIGVVVYLVVTGLVNSAFARNRGCSRKDV